LLALVAPLAPKRSEQSLSPVSCLIITYAGWRSYGASAPTCSRNPTAGTGSRRQRCRHDQHRRRRRARGAGHARDARCDRAGQWLPVLLQPARTSSPRRSSNSARARSSATSSWRDERCGATRDRAAPSPAQRLRPQPQQRGLAFGARKRIDARFFLKKWREYQGWKSAGSWAGVSGRY